MKDYDIEFASKLFDNGKFTELYEFISVFVEAREPNALYFYSKISLSEWNESGDQFDQRRLKLLSESSDGGIGEASYQLACCYLYGEGLEIDRDKAEFYIDRAIEAGHASAKLLKQQ